MAGLRPSGYLLGPRLRDEFQPLLAHGDVKGDGSTRSLTLSGAPKFGSSAYKASSRSVLLSGDLKPETAAATIFIINIE